MTPRTHSIHGGACVARRDSMHRSENGHYTGCASRRIGRAGRRFGRPGVRNAIDPAEATALRIDRARRTYYFCGDGCRESPEVEFKSMRTIKRNLFWAFIDNAVSVLSAAFGLLNPIIAAAAMALSSLSVIVNSALLKRARLQYSWRLP